MGLRPSDFLAHYALRFATAEINNTFYRLPTLETLDAWVDRVPEAQYRGHVAVRQGAPELQRLAGLAKGHATFEQGTLLDLAVLAIALAQQNGGR